MKTTQHISLNGQAFCIDEDAYTKLQYYISTLENHYLKEEGGKEIMTDIESRIAELFSEALQKVRKEVISLSDVDAVIGIMGNPTDIIDEATEYETPPVRRKLYRDPEQAVIGGVAAGIAVYFGISPILVRIAFILLLVFSGTALLPYLILWIVIPKAVTTKQKLEMRGENANISNIERKIRTTYQEVSQNNKFRHVLYQINRVVTDFFRALGSILTRIFTLLTGIFAVLGLVVGAFFILIGFVLVFSPHYTGIEEIYTLGRHFFFTLCRFFSFSYLYCYW